MTTRTTNSIKLFQQTQKNKKDGKEYIYFSLRYNHNGKRKVESIGIKCLKNPRTSAERAEVKQQKALAEQIYLDRQRANNLNKNGLQDYQRSQGLFLDEFDRYVSLFGTEWGNSETANFGLVRKHLENYNPNIAVAGINVEFSKGFANYLSSLTKRNTDQLLHKNSVKTYFKKYAQVAKYLWSQGFISSDPTYRVKISDQEKEQSPHLSEEELKVAFNTPIAKGREIVRDAWLFSTLTGLRLSDLRALTYGHLHEELDGTPYLQMRMTKTSTTIKVYLSPSAMEIIGTKGAENERVFAGINGNVNQYEWLKYWMLGDCGINKEITWHSARHTFAYRYYRHTKDIVALQHLLGHKDLSTTQVYAHYSAEDSKQDLVNMPRL